MKPIAELYHFDKFWDMYTRQNRSISIWDETRTDQDVFIRRTLGKWFTNRFYQILLKKYPNNEIDNMLNGYKPADHYKTFTKYVYITNILFAYAPYFDLITIYYLQPHSEKIERVDYGRGELNNLMLIENESDFRILQKFYPVNKVPIILPTLNHVLPMVELSPRKKKKTIA